MSEGIELYVQSCLADMWNNRLMSYLEHEQLDVRPGRLAQDSRPDIDMDIRRYAQWELEQKEFKR